EVKFRRIELFVLNIFCGVEGVERTHHHFFRHCACKQANSCLPVIFMYANRLEDRGVHPADGSQRRVVDVIDDFPAQREAVESATENAEDEKQVTSTKKESV